MLQSVAPMAGSSSAALHDMAMLDSPDLLDALYMQAKPSYSSIGRAMDVDKAMKFASQRSAKRRTGSGDHTDADDGSEKKGSSVASAVMMSGSAFINRRERRRKMQQQRAQQQAWQVAEETTLRIPHMPTMMPAFTKTVHAGTTALGGTQLDGPEFRTMIGLVPTRKTIEHITEYDELISSIRPYTYDAARTAREEQLRHTANPHPDYLHHLDDIFNKKATLQLMDETTLPGAVRTAAAMARASSLHPPQEDGAAATRDGTTHSDSDRDRHPHKSQRGHRSPRPAGHSTRTRDTTKQTPSSLTLQRHRHRRPPRHSAMRNYHPRYTQVEARVRGGYVEPLAAAAAPRRSAHPLSHSHSPLADTTDPSPSRRSVSPSCHSCPSLSDGEEGGAGGRGLWRGASSARTATRRTDTSGTSDGDAHSRREPNHTHTHEHAYTKWAQLMRTPLSGKSGRTMAELGHTRTRREQGARTPASHVTRRTTTAAAARVASDVEDESAHNHTPATAAPPSSFPSSARRKPAPATAHRRNGSPVFVSRTPREGRRIASDAPDVCYWPYPDIRSTHPRSRHALFLCGSAATTTATATAAAATGGAHATINTHACRRDVYGEGVPAVGCYEVSHATRVLSSFAGDARGRPGGGLAWSTQTSRETPVWSRRGTAPPPPSGTHGLRDADAAGLCYDVYAAVRPHVPVTRLPPRSADSTTHTNTATRRQGATTTTTVSVECDANFPPPVIGHPAALAHVRSFDKMAGRDMNSPAVGAVVLPRETAEVCGAEVRYGLVDRRARAATIHPRVPGHGDVVGAAAAAAAAATAAAVHGSGSADEVTGAPSLRLVKPNTEHAARLETCVGHRAEQVPMHDLSYNVTTGYGLLHRRVTGDPMMSSHISRTQRERVSRHGKTPAAAAAAAHGNAGSRAATRMMWNSRSAAAAAVNVGDGNMSVWGALAGGDGGGLGSAAKSKREECDFAKQVTKETQFTGHSVASERWTRGHPRAPGPGHYVVSYSQVDKHNSVPQIA